MDIAINDVSFMYKVKSLEQAKEALIGLEKVTTYLKSEIVTEVRYIMNDEYIVNQALMITDKHNLAAVLKSISDMEVKRRIIQLLVNSNTVDLTDVPTVKIGEYESKICYYYKDSFIVSIDSHQLFENEKILALYAEDELTIKNISKMEHIDVYHNELGIRIFEPNHKHSNKKYVRAGGESVSVMPLSEEMAQKVLNRSVKINGKIYGMLDGKYFEFRRTIDNIFHCFQNDELDIHTKKQIVEMINNKDFYSVGDKK